jgi:arginine/lysine/ornithine decarboxylase
VEHLARRPHDFSETVRRISREGEAPALSRPPAAFEQETAVTPREAFLGRGETVAVERAVGRISAESIAGYPPGIPALLPGERITAEVIGYLREITRAGARLHGAADPSLATVRVLAR